jgi:membrane-associated protease RseP (regulator of RpoE activity)
VASGDVRVRRFFAVTRVSGATVYVHWSVLAITALMMLAAVEDALVTLFAVGAYLGLLLLHEWGHLVAARRSGCAVWSIELYPLHGFTRCSAPPTHYAACVIAWGGVLAQLAVAVPLILLATVFGLTPIGLVNALVVIFGYFSAVIAVINLLPLPRLDGGTAWRIVPYLLRRMRRRPHVSLSRGSRSRRPRAPTKPPEGRWLH